MSITWICELVDLIDPLMILSNSSVDPYSSSVFLIYSKVTIILEYRNFWSYINTTKKGLDWGFEIFLNVFWKQKLSNDSSE